MIKMFRSELYRFSKSLWNIVIVALFIFAVVVTSSILTNLSGLIGNYDISVDTANLWDFYSNVNDVSLLDGLALPSFENLSMSLFVQAIIAMVFSIIFMFAVIVNDVNSKHIANAIAVGNTRLSVFGGKLLLSFLVSTILLIIEVPVVLILFRLYGVPIVILPSYFVRTELSYLLAIYFVDTLCLVIAFISKKLGSAIVLSLTIIAIIFASGRYYTEANYLYFHYYTDSGRCCFDDLDHEYFQIIDYQSEDFQNVLLLSRSEEYPIFVDLENGIEVLKYRDIEIEGTIQKKNPNYRTGLSKIFFKLCVYYNPLGIVSEYNLPFDMDTGCKYMHSQSICWICEDVLLIVLISFIGMEVYKRRDI